ncbi:hypothetical protein DFS34DRAFT_489935 [Phlyctochytrium arcticum]|nr:hypothetical protein DFS34DRAFT_489935 [Phlyctochytrium arcticum]
MNFLEMEVEKFVDLDQSEEFIEAHKIVKRHQDLLDSIKRTMKPQRIMEVKVRRGKLVKRLKFNIKTYRRVNAAAMPEELRQIYMRDTEYWYKNVDILETGELPEKIKTEGCFGGGSSVVEIKKEEGSVVEIEKEEGSVVEIKKEEGSVVEIKKEEPV